MEDDGPQAVRGVRGALRLHTPLEYQFKGKTRLSSFKVDINELFVRHSGNKIGVFRSHAAGPPRFLHCKGVATTITSEKKTTCPGYTLTEVSAAEMQNGTSLNQSNAMLEQPYAPVRERLTELEELLKDGSRVTGAVDTGSAASSSGSFLGAGLAGGLLSKESAAALLGPSREGKTTFVQAFTQRRTQEKGPPTPPSRVKRGDVVTRWSTATTCSTVDFTYFMNNRHEGPTAPSHGTDFEDCFDGAEDNLTAEQLLQTMLKDPLCQAAMDEVEVQEQADKRPRGPFPVLSDQFEASTSSPVTILPSNGNKVEVLVPIVSRESCFKGRFYTKLHHKLEMEGGHRTEEEALLLRDPDFQLHVDRHMDLLRISPAWRIGPDGGAEYKANLQRAVDTDFRIPQKFRVLFEGEVLVMQSSNEGGCGYEEARRPLHDFLFALAAGKWGIWPLISLSGVVVLMDTPTTIVDLPGYHVDSTSRNSFLDAQLSALFNVHTWVLLYRHGINEGLLKKLYDSGILPDFLTTHEADADGRLATANRVPLELVILVIVDRHDVHLHTAGEYTKVMLDRAMQNAEERTAAGLKAAMKKVFHDKGEHFNRLLERSFVEGWYKFVPVTTVVEAGRNFDLLGEILASNKERWDKAAVAVQAAELLAKKRALETDLETRLRLGSVQTPQLRREARILPATVIRSLKNKTRGILKEEVTCPIRKEQAAILHKARARCTLDGISRLLEAEGFKNDGRRLRTELLKPTVDNAVLKCVLAAVDEGVINFRNYTLSEYTLNLGWICSAIDEILRSRQFLKELSPGMRHILKPASAGPSSWDPLAELGVRRLRQMFRDILVSRLQLGLIHTNEDLRILVRLVALQDHHFPAVSQELLCSTDTSQRFAALVLRGAKMAQEVCDNVGKVLDNYLYECIAQVAEEVAESFSTILHSSFTGQDQAPDEHNRHSILEYKKQLDQAEQRVLRELQSLGLDEDARLGSSVDRVLGGAGASGSLASSKQRITDRADRGAVPDMTEKEVLELLRSNEAEAIMSTYDRLDILTMVATLQLESKKRAPEREETSRLVRILKKQAKKRAREDDTKRAQRAKKRRH